MCLCGVLSLWNLLITYNKRFQGSETVLFISFHATVVNATVVNGTDYRREVSSLNPSGQKGKVIRERSARLYPHKSHQSMEMMPPPALPLPVLISLTSSCPHTWERPTFSFLSYCIYIYINLQIQNKVLRDLKRRESLKFFSADSYFTSIIQSKSGCLKISYIKQITKHFYIVSH